MSGLSLARVRMGTNGMVSAKHSFSRITLWIGIVYLALVVIAAIFGSMLAPYDPNATDLRSVLSSPTFAHPFGTDKAGRDTFSRLIVGARTGLFAPLAVVTIATVVGVLLGVLTAAKRGAVDGVIGRAIDLVLAFPDLLIAMLIVAIFGAGLIPPTLALAVAFIPTMFRLTRSLVLSEQERAYVSAYRVLGCNSRTIYLRYVLPNVSGVILANCLVQFGYALMGLASLSFLGFGAQPPDSDWGVMVRDGQAALLQGSPYQSLFAGGAIICTVVAMNALGTWVSERLTPGGNR